MKTFTSYYEKKQTETSRTYWKEGNRVFVRYTTKDTDEKNELCINTTAEQIHYSENRIYFRVKTKSGTIHYAQTDEEIKYIASLANLSIIYKSN